MRWGPLQGLRIPVIILVFISALGLAILSESLVHGNQVTNPLVADLQSVAGVSQATVEGRGNKTKVNVYLEDGIDLISVYPNITALVERYLGPNTGHLYLTDGRDANLTDMYHALRFQIEEGLATGHFTRMASEVAAAAEGAGISTHRIYMDSQNVYVQLHDDTAYLYEVVPRYPSPSITNNA